MESNAVQEENKEVDEKLAEEYSPEALALEEQKMSSPGLELNVARLMKLMQSVTEQWDKE